MAELKKDSSEQGVHQDGTTTDEHTILQDIIKDLITLQTAINAQHAGAVPALLSSNQS